MAIDTVAFKLYGLRQLLGGGLYGVRGPLDGLGFRV